MSIFVAAGRNLKNAVWSEPPERDSGISEAFQSVDLYGATRKPQEGYHLPQPPLNFIFREYEYKPSTEPQAIIQPRIFLKIG